jgi:hypothetical protein
MIRYEATIVVQEIELSLLQPHPCNREIYGEEDVSELVGYIAQSQWIKPLVISQNNRIISGHRRWQAARVLGYASVPCIRQIFQTEIDELKVLLLENASRDKTAEQKVREGDKWKNVEEEAALRRQKELAGTRRGPDLQENFPEGLGQSRDKIAERVGFGSGRTYEKAMKVVQRADQMKDEGKVKEAHTLLHVLNGHSVDAAARVLALPRDVQVTALNKVASGEVTTIQAAILATKQEQVEEQAQAAPTRPCIVLADFQDWLPDQQPCDLLLTDPPYSTDVDEIETFAASWLPVALSKVKETGRAYVCIGAYPRELKAYLNVAVPDHLHLLNVLVWTYKNTLGPSPTYAYKQNWQAILYFAGVCAPRLDCSIMNEQFSVQEINAPDGRVGNHYHAWQKPDDLAERLIRHSTKAGDIVLDCFSGTGTFLLAAHRLGRVALGCEYSATMLEIASRRGCEVQR